MVQDKKIEKPTRPLDNECCGGGACCPCVWDDYFDKLEKWQEYEREQQQKESKESTLKADQ